jgi:GNAT acetyltransferase-like protein
MPKKTDNLPKLFCKPDKNFSSNNLFQNAIPEIGIIAFRSLDIAKDLDTIYDWVNQDYSRQFWQMNGSRELLKNTYLNILSNPHAHSFIGSLNDTAICQIDLYQVLNDELSNHVEANDSDCGLHLLMSPPDQRIKGLTLIFFKTFLAFYFSFPEAIRMFGEPDKENIKSNQLVINSGFEFMKTIGLSYKTANLYCITKTQFYATNQISRSR